VIRVFVLSCVALSLGCVEEPPADDAENRAPIARLFFPQMVAVNEPAQFDARETSDPDADALVLELDPGDGTPSATTSDGTFAHVYDAPGSFAVRLAVTDESDVTSFAAGEVVVVADDASCSCDLGCFDDAVCTNTGCVSYATSTEEDAREPRDPIDCD
jgi:hypothetical protein